MVKIFRRTGNESAAEVLNVINNVRVHSKKFILQTAENGCRSNPPKASPLK